MAQIQQEIIDNKDKFELGDSDSDIISLINLFFPVVAEVKDPVMYIDSFSGDELPVGWGAVELENDCMSGFTVLIPIEFHRLSFTYVQAFRNYLDMYSRYPSYEYGPNGSDLGSSLSFYCSSKELDSGIELKIRFFLDDSTR